MSYTAFRLLVRRKWEMGLLHSPAYIPRIRSLSGMDAPLLFRRRFQHFDFYRAQFSLEGVFFRVVAYGGFGVEAGA